ncbi:MAG TPA: glycine--tRNA ligase subunit beta [Anaerolineae bacterium]|nr:glycine--tRNA ligase subunit beta [Anaerolineae bacterium]
MSKRGLLLEIGTEEIPAASVVIGDEQLKERAQLLFDRHRLGFDSIKTYGAPRRIALLVDGLEEKQARAVHEVRGPAKKVAYTADGQPTRAAIGFAKSQGVEVESLVTRAHDGGEYVFAVKAEEGRDAIDILGTVLPEFILSLSFPKAMRWGNGEIRFVRPIRWIVALFGDEVIPFTLDGIASGRHSMGHRFLVDNPITIEKPDDYVGVLERNKVIVDQEKRSSAIRAEIEDSVRDTGGRAVVHAHTFDEVLQLVEYPHAIRGSFSGEFVSLPRDVLVTAMESHQRYFPVEDASGKLLPNFIVIHNGNPTFMELIQKGHERVIRARLSDAKFFFESDSSKPLESYIDKLKGVIFQIQLGTVYQKTQRLVELSRNIARSLDLTQEEVEYATRAAYLSKTDLVTEMVGEFPTLQGVMGREYALVSGEPEQVATGIFEHYLPRLAGDMLPQTTTGRIVSIADKLDSIAGILAVGLIPTGSEDPYALRRQAYGIVSIILENTIDIAMSKLIELALTLYREQDVEFDFAVMAGLVEDFLRGRLRAYLLARQLPADVIEAVASRSINDMVDIKRRAEALADKLGSSEMADVLVAFTRCKNLAKPEFGMQVDTSLLREEAEKELYARLIGVDKEIEKADGDYLLSIDVLARLRESVDRFFDEVLVMAKDEAVRNNRIKLLNHCLDTFHKVADFSYISPAMG